MRQINPLLLLFLVIVLLILGALFVKHEKNKEETILKELQTNKLMAKQIVSYKNSWENKRVYDKKLQYLFSMLNRKHIKFIKNSFSKHIALTFDKLNMGNATYILSTILNQNFKIKTLKINKIDNNKLKLFIEVKR